MDELDAPAAIAFALVLIVLAGSAMSWFACLSNRKAVRVHRPPPPFETSWINFAIFAWALMVVVIGAMWAVAKIHGPGEPDGNAHPDGLWIAVSSVFGIQASMLLVFLGARVICPAPFAARLNHRGSPPGRAVQRGVTIFLRAVPVLWLAAFGWSQCLQMLSEWGLIEPPKPQLIVDFLSRNDQALPIALLIAIAVLGAPIIEELIFRGCFYRFFKSKFGALASLFLSALIFATIHANAAAFVPLLILGFMLAKAYHDEGSILVPITIHLLFNALSVTIIKLISMSPGIDL